VKKLFAAFIIITPHFFAKISSQILFLFLELASVSFILTSRPFIRKLDNMVELLCETIQMIFVIIMLIYSDPEMWDRKSSVAISALLLINCIIMSFIMIGDSVFYLSSFAYSKCKRKPKKVQSELEIKQIKNITKNYITHLTTMTLEERKQSNYEESKLEITLEDISSFKRKGKTFKE